MTAFELLEAGSKWTDVRTRVAFPLLLSIAERGGTIEYGQLNALLVTKGFKSALPIAYKTVAGKIGDICDALASDSGILIPPLNAIVVSAPKQLPSNGVDTYLERFLGLPRRSLRKMDDSARDAYARQAVQTVHDFSNWQKVRELLSLAPAKLSTEINLGGRIPLPNPRGFSWGLESEGHKKLKEWVAANGGLFGKFAKGNTEQLLSSGDRLDVFFRNDSLELAIEVKTKNASDAEVQRGIYQCIKYRATLRAMQLAQARAPNANAILVIDKEPSNTVKKLALRLSVKIKNVQHLYG